MVNVFMMFLGVIFLFGCVFQEEKVPNEEIIVNNGSNQGNYDYTENEELYDILGITDSTIVKKIKRISDFKELFNLNDLFESNNLNDFTNNYDKNEYGNDKNMRLLFSDNENFLFPISERYELIGKFLFQEKKYLVIKSVAESCGVFGGLQLFYCDFVANKVRSVDVYGGISDAGIYSDGIFSSQINDSLIFKETITNYYIGYVTDTSLVTNLVKEYEGFWSLDSLGKLQQMSNLKNMYLQLEHLKTGNFDTLYNIPDSIKKIY